MLVLGIETSCDETGVALVEDGRIVRANVLGDQQELHRRYGGVVPEVASRAHVDLLHPAVEEACADAGVRLGDVDAVAVTVGPGLAGALLVGVAAAKAYAFALGVPLIGVNHLVAHVYANVLEYGELQLPAVVFVVSGGHTSVLVMDGDKSLRMLGQTIDDAAGEAYDKVARVLGLGYPGGPEIDRLAREGDPRAVAFPRPLLGDGTYDFSLSGVKTAVARHVRRLRDAGAPVPVADLAASFQEAVVDVQVRKLVTAARDEGLDTVLLAGGVAANSRLRAQLSEAAARRSIRVLAPAPALCTDNGAMVACAGFFALQRGEVTALDVGADPSLALVEGIGRRAARRVKSHRKPVAQAVGADPDGGDGANVQAAGTANQEAGTANQRVGDAPEAAPPVDHFARRGLTPSAWSAGAGVVFDVHAHAQDKLLVCRSGSIAFTLHPQGELRELQVGDWLQLPAGQRHSAVAGPAGVQCEEAFGAIVDAPSRSRQRPVGLADADVP